VTNLAVRIVGKRTYIKESYILFQIKREKYSK